MNPALHGHNMRPLKNGNLCSSSRKAKISTTGIYGIFRGLKSETDAEIGHKVPFRSLRLSAKVSIYCARARLVKDKNAKKRYSR